MNYLTGKQIELRAVEPEDIDLLYRWENNASLWKYGCTIAPFSRYLLKQYIEHYSADIARDNQLRLIVVKKEDRQPIGIIDCFDYDATHRRAAIGILIDPLCTRQGFGRDALETFMRYAFEVLFLHAARRLYRCPAVAKILLQINGYELSEGSCGELSHNWYPSPMLRTVSRQKVSSTAVRQLTGDCMAVTAHDSCRNSPSSCPGDQPLYPNKNCTWSRTHSSLRRKSSSISKSPLAKSPSVISTAPGKAAISCKKKR